MDWVVSNPVHSIPLYSILFLDHIVVPFWFIKILLRGQQRPTDTVQTCFTKLGTHENNNAAEARDDEDNSQCTKKLALKLRGHLQIADPGSGQ